jgi:hypothetical protein
MIESLAEKHPAIVINTVDCVHVISVVTLRQLANGETYNGDVNEFIQLLSKALVDLIK